jgi:hypothetical protein
MTEGTSRTESLLWSLSGPPGPMRSEADDERERQALLAGDPDVAASRLLDVLRRSTPPADVKLENMQTEAADLLSELLLASGSEVFERLIAALEDPATRATALDAFALSAEERAGSRLADLVDLHRYKDWTDRELMKLASALGSIESDETRRAFAILNARGGWSRTCRASSISRPSRPTSDRQALRTK